MRRIPSFLVPFSLTIASALAADIVYVTDLAIFTSLAPCAASALSYNVMSQTYDNCPEAVTELKNCVCTKGNNFASVASELSSSVSYSCGGTASEDQASARTVLSAYCDQDNIPAFPEPATPVELYITDIPEFDYLAPCAASAVSYAFNTMTYYNCPSEAPLLATCACGKNQNSLVISQIINTSAKSSCSGHSADITSAQAFFSAYCNLNNGTSSFPAAPDPPGEMTYYITDMAEYSSLAPCASRALSYAVQYQTWYLCPEGPMALASCACIKEGIASDIISTVRSSIKEGCGAPGTEDISSALSVFDFYCSAARAEVTPNGITNSIAQTYATGASGVTRGGGGFGGGPQETGAPDVDGDSEGSTGGSGSRDKKASSGPSIGVIVGVVVGVVVVLVALAGIVFFVIRSKKRKAAAQEQIPDNPAPSGMPDYFNGKQELAGTEISAVPAAAGGPIPPPSPSPSTLKVGAPGRMDNVSPVSAHASAFTPPPNKSELHGQTAPYPPMPTNSAELQGQTSPYAPPPMPPNSAELYAQGNVYPPPNRPELQGQGAMYPPPNRPELQGQGSPHFPPPNRPELAGYYYPQPQHQQQQPMPMGQMSTQMSPPPMQGYQYQQQQHQQHAYPNSQHLPPHLANVGPGQQPPIELSPMSWQSGPVPGLHEMDAGPRGVPGPGPGSPRSPPPAPGQAV